MYVLIPKRGDTMNMTAVLMPSVTHAIKAKRIFFSMGYTCEVKRASDVSKKGCTHYIAVNANINTVISILKKNGIKYGEILREAVEQNDS